MGIRTWETHTLAADNALEQQDHQLSILHYQQALAVSEELEHALDIDLEDRLMISVMSCHNLARFWREVGNNQYELKYLQLASEKVLTVVPQCPHSECDAFIDSIGCCKKALIEFMKRHPNPSIARLVQDIDTASNCQLIAKFKLN